MGVVLQAAAASDATDLAGAPVSPVGARLPDDRDRRIADGAGGVNDLLLALRKIQLHLCRAFRAGADQLIDGLGQSDKFSVVSQGILRMRLIKLEFEIVFKIHGQGLSPAKTPFWARTMSSALEASKTAEHAPSAPQE